MTAHKAETKKAALILLNDWDGLRFGPRVDVLYEALCRPFFKQKTERLALRIVRYIEERKAVA